MMNMYIQILKGKYLISLAAVTCLFSFSKAPCTTCNICWLQEGGTLLPGVFERVFVYNPAGFILLLIEVFSLSVFVVLKHQQSQPCMMTHRLNINQHLVQTEMIHGCSATGVCHTTLEAACFGPFKPIDKTTDSSEVLHLHKKIKQYE